MVDIKLNLDTENLRFDLAVKNFDLETTEDIETAVYISLFTDRRARIDHRLPGMPQDPDDLRGWCGDQMDDRRDDEIGSLLWLLEREVNVIVVIAKAKTYAEESLLWLIQDGLVKQITVASSALTQNVLLIEVLIWKNDGARIPLSYEYAWRE